jgi:hypothetical protein
MKSILDPAFRYTPSTSTDLRKTFARIRREMQRAGASAAPVPTPDSHVVPFGRSKQTASARR